MEITTGIELTASYAYLKDELQNNTRYNTNSKYKHIAPKGLKNDCAHKN